MARKPLRPLIRSGGFYPSRKWTPLVYAGGYTTANSGEEPAPPPIEKTITGNPIHILDALAKPAQALSVKLEPVQDLNGYSYPWPAGGGKNLLWLNNGIFKTGAFPNTTPRETTGVGTWVGMTSSNYLAANSIVSYTIGDNNLTVKSSANGYGVGFECKVTAGQQYTLSWVGTNAYVGIAFYDAAGEYLSYVTSGASPKTFTVPESTANAIIVLRGDAANVTGEFSNVQLEEGQTATAYSPYANICPISGWTGANVTRTGKNLLNSNTITQNKIIDNTGAIVTNNAIEITDYIRVKPGTQYVLSGTSLNGNSSNADVRVNFYTADKTWKYRSGTNKTNGLIFTTDADTYFVRFSFSKDSTDQMCEEGSTATPFVAYNGSTYSITFPSEAGTVYGGTLNVTTGLLTVTYGNIASYSGETLPGRWISSMDVYSAGGTPTIGAQVVYELATPIVYDLTPTEVTLLLGENNIWSDGEMTLTYLADGNASDEEALNILLGGRYVNNHSEDEPTDREALNIILGGNER